MTVASLRADGSLSRALVDIVQRAAHAPLQASAVDATHRLVTNWLGCALGAARDPAVMAALRVATALGASSAASIVGHACRLDVVNASLVNGISANALDYDDMHVPTLIHPTGAVVATAMALAEQRHADGHRFLRAVAAGIEVECRLGQLLFPDHYDKGWHISSTLGTLGAAAAGSVLLGLDATRTAHAFGLASTQAGGLRAMLPNPCKSFNIGKAAAAGTLSALLAEAGFESEPASLEARFGFFDLFGWPADPDHALASLRRADGPWMVTQASLKPYPCGVVIHPVIDACLAVTAMPGFDAARVCRVTLAVHPRTLVLAGRQHPADAINARFSLFHAAALALSKRSAGLAAFDGCDVEAPDLHALRERMVAVPEAERSPGSCRASVELDDGTSFVHEIDQPRGSPAHPLSDAFLADKFNELAMRAMDAASAQTLYVTCLQLDRMPDMAALAAHWAGPPANPPRERDR